MTSHTSVLGQQQEGEETSPLRGMSVPGGRGGCHTRAAWKNLGGSPGAGMQFFGKPWAVVLVKDP